MAKVPRPHPQLLRKGQHHRRVAAPRPTALQVMAQKVFLHHQYQQDRLQFQVFIIDTTIYSDNCASSNKLDVGLHSNIVLVVILIMLIFRKRNDLGDQSSDIGVQDDEIEIIEESSLNDSRGGQAEERQHSVSQIVSTTEYDSSRYGHSNGSFETGMLTSACAHFLYKARLLNNFGELKPDPETEYYFATA